MAKQQKIRLAMHACKVSSLPKTGQSRKREQFLPAPAPPQPVVWYAVHCVYAGLLSEHLPAQEVVINSNGCGTFLRLRAAHCTNAAPGCVSSRLVGRRLAEACNSSMGVFASSGNSQFE